MTRNNSRPPTEEEIAERHAFRGRLQETLDSLQIAPGTFAKKAGIATGTMYYLLQDGDATRSTLVSIVRAAGISLDWLVMGQGPSPAQSPSPFFMRIAEVTFRKAFKNNWAELPILERDSVLAWAATVLANLLSADKNKAETEFLEYQDSRRITAWMVQAVQLRSELLLNDEVTLACRLLVRSPVSQAKDDSTPANQKASRRKVR